MRVILALVLAKVGALRPMAQVAVVGYAALLMALAALTSPASAQPREYTFEIRDSGPYMYSGESAVYNAVVAVDDFNRPTATGWSGSFIGEDTNGNGRIQRSELLGFEGTVTLVFNHRDFAFDSEVFSQTLSSVTAFSYDLNGTIGFGSNAIEVRQNTSSRNFLTVSACSSTLGSKFPFDCATSQIRGVFSVGVAPIDVTQGEVIAGPTAGFTASSTVLTGVPANVTFTDTATIDARVTAARYTWDFGDGGTSTAASPLYSYTTPGNYTVSQTVCIGSLCDTTTQEITVAGGDPASVTLSGLSGDLGPVAGNIQVTLSIERAISTTFGDALALADFNVSGATLANLSAGSGTAPEVYTFDVIPDGAPSITLSLPEGVVFDVENAPNAASNVLTAAYDGTPPTIAITSSVSALAAGETAALTFTLSEDATDFEAADVTVTGGSLSGFTGTGSSYTATFTPTAGTTGNAVISVADGAFTDAAGNANADGADADNTLTIAVDTGIPTVTLAGTPGFPGDPYAIDITFSEPVNGFTLAGITGDGAVISDFGNTCGTDPCASFSAVVIPSGGREFSHSVSVPADVAQDVAGNFNLASPAFAPPPPDGLAPVLTITGVPNGFAGPQTATVTFDWGEDVLGFTDADITVTGGTLGAITGGRQTWTAQLTIDGTADVTVAVAAAAVQDASGTASVAASVTGTFASGSVAEELIREFIAARASSLIAAQPGLTGLLDNAAPSGSIQVTRGFGDVQFRTGSEGPVWAALDAQWSDIDGFQTAYTHLTFGTHTYLQDRTLLGVMLQLDHAASSEGVARIEGTGWLVGPYYVARYGGVDVDARLLWGRTENEISPVGTYTDTFASERVLAMVNLSGEIEAGATTLRPLVGWAYVDDRSEAYVDALANPVAAQRVRLSEFEAALDWSMPVGPGGTEFTGGIAGIYTSEQGGNGSLDGPRGRIDMGLRRQGAGPLGFDIGVYADGLFQPGFERYGVDVSVDWRF